MIITQKIQNSESTEPKSAGHPGLQSGDYHVFDHLFRHCLHYIAPKSPLVPSPQILYAACVSPLASFFIVRLVALIDIMPLLRFLSIHFTVYIYYRRQHILHITTKTHIQ